MTYFTVNFIYISSYCLTWFFASTYFILFFPVNTMFFIAVELEEAHMEAIPYVARIAELEGKCINRKHASCFCI